MGNVYNADDFQYRVKFAASYISAKKPSTRRFDTCFEMWDGDAVAAALVRRVDKQPGTKLAANLFKYIGEDGARKASDRLGPNLNEEARKLRYDAQERRSL